MKKKRLIRVTTESILSERKNECESCGRKEWLTLDHIVPIQIIVFLLNKNKV